MKEYPCQADAAVRIQWLQIGCSRWSMKNCPACFWGAHALIKIQPVPAGLNKLQPVYIQLKGYIHLSGKNNKMHIFLYEKDVLFFFLQQLGKYCTCDRVVQGCNVRLLQTCPRCSFRTTSHQLLWLAVVVVDLFIRNYEWMMWLHSCAVFFKLWWRLWG